MTYFLLDGDEEIAELSSNGTVLRRYINGPGTDERIAAAEGAGTANPPKTYYHVNHQGSVIAMSDAAGSATGCATGLACQRIAYDEYGILGTGSVVTGQPYRFTGRRFDEETGLYYYRARYYSPVLGRFLQTDPIGYADNLNLYAYTGNDPLDATDPSGECPNMVNDTTPCDLKQIAVELAAQDLVDRAIFSPFTTQAAREILVGFVTGTGSAVQRFGPSDQATKELVSSSYIKEVLNDVANQMATKQGGSIQNGTSFRGKSRDFTPIDAAKDAINGIDVSDVVGTITRSIFVTAQNDKLTFIAENRTTLTSFAGGNLLGTRVANPVKGPLATKTQIFTIILPIPPQYLPSGPTP